ncbi:MAG: heavy-metal-associated domain-containing protein [Eubacterium sp.]|jgi:copper chaperone CopZ
MWKYTVEVDGMMCGMCESHINDEVRKNFNVKKVSSSRSKKRTVIQSESEIDEASLRKVISDTGYRVGDIKKEKVEKKKFFGV